MKAVECTDLHAAYDRRCLHTDAEILHGISLSLEEGKRLAILGSNGSGKSTLLKALTAMIPTSGSVSLLGKDVAGMKRREIASCAAYMTQISQIFFSYTVFETVLMGRYLHSSKGLGRYTEEDMEKTEECLKRTGVAALRDRQLFRAVRRGGKAEIRKGIDRAAHHRARRIHQLRADRKPAFCIAFSAVEKLDAGGFCRIDIMSEKLSCRLNVCHSHFSFS